jgi:hypothetical protein
MSIMKGTKLFLLKVIERAEQLLQNASEAQ